uniref:Uncharacterized protein n=1 Tax=Pararge aegeria TaxID=116150 RepID=S4NZ56_9NEOP
MKYDRWLNLCCTTEWSPARRDCRVAVAAFSGFRATFRSQFNKPLVVFMLCCILGTNKRRNFYDRFIYLYIYIYNS